MTDSKYDVFLCYHSGGGQDFALHLWDKLPHIKQLTTFINIRNIDAKYKEETDEYRKIIDKAILNCKYFVLIMTRGFKDRDEVIREYKLAKDNKRTIIHCKYITMRHNDCIMVIDGEDWDLYNIHHIEFNNNSTLYIKVADEIEGIIQRDITGDYQNKELFKDFFEPIYLDIDEVIEKFDSEGYSLEYHAPPYDKLRRKKTLQLKKYSNKELLEKIYEFYAILYKRQIHLGRYPKKANNIINQCVESIIRTKNVKRNIDKNRAVYIDVKYNVENSEGEIEEKDLNLSYDVLFLNIGISLLRGGVNRKALNFTKVLLHRDGGKAIDISSFWDEIYSCIERKAIVDDTLKYLRDSVKVVTELGNEILKEIEAEFSAYY